MLDFEIQRFTRRCAATNRDLQPGDTYYSVLLSEGSNVVRRDYAEEAWKGAPDDAIGFWRARMPASNNQKTQWAPNDVMLDYLVRLEDDPARVDVRYVLALLLVRRRVLRWEETEQAPTGDVMLLHCPRNETEYRVAHAAPDAERARVIQEELAQLLFGRSK
jgi:hypothetical protein